MKGYRGIRGHLTGVGFLDLGRESGVRSRESGVGSRESGVGSRDKKFECTSS
ncbi:AraC family transcriptional regulator [Moorena producens]|uniref:AraC family transcriptional regulator n=1 Tax=Moorena producens TaxID=1155739 RepID=UPI003C75DCD5